MAWSWSGAGSGALAGSSGGWIGAGIGGLLGGLFGDTGGSEQATGPNLMDLYSQIIDEYSYKPQYTAQTEASLYDLFQRLTGQGNYAGAGNGDVNAIPFDIGLPTTGLYDSLTRGIKQDYLGTPGGAESGKIADLKAYYNNLGVPEQALNAERLAYQDMNNSLLDKAALINESQKDRLSGLLQYGGSLGNNLYSQNLAQHRANAGLMGTAALGDFGLLDEINRANAQSVSDLGIGTGTTVGNSNSSFGGLFNSNPNAPTSISRNGDNSLSSLFGKAKNFIAPLLGGN